MEVSLFEAVGLPEGSVLSVRAGNTRRQAPVPLAGPLRFPNLPFNAKQFKVDVMKTLGSAKLEIRAAKELESYSVNVDMPDGEQARIGFTVREQAALCGKRASELKQVDRSQDGDTDQSLIPADKAWAATDTRTYAREHNIPNFVQEMLQMVLREKPDTPFTVMAEYLHKKAIELGEKPRPLDSGGQHETTMREPQRPQKQSQYSASFQHDTGDRYEEPPQTQKQSPYSGYEEPPRTQKQSPYSSSYQQETGGRTLPTQSRQGAPSFPPRESGFQEEEGTFEQKSAPPPSSKQPVSSYYEGERDRFSQKASPPKQQPQRGLPAQYEEMQNEQQPQQIMQQQRQPVQQQLQQQPTAQKRYVSHQLPADEEKNEVDFGLRSTANKHKMQRMATSVLDDPEYDDEENNAEFYVPKAEREREHDDNSSYGGGPDGYIPKVPALGASQDQYDEVVATYTKGGKARPAAEVAARAGRMAGNQKSVPPGRKAYEEFQRHAPGRGLKSVPGPQKAALRAARTADDPDRAQLEAEHMALQAERASLLHDLARLNQKLRH